VFVIHSQLPYNLHNNVGVLHEQLSEEIATTAISSHYRVFLLSGLSRSWIDFDILARSSTCSRRKIPNRFRSTFDSVCVYKVYPIFQKRLIMRNYLLIVLLAFVVASCRKDGRDGETILKGTAKVLVDESIYPMVEDQVAVFETDYDAKINLLARSEAEAIQAFFKDSAQII